MVYLEASTVSSLVARGRRKSLGESFIVVSLFAYPHALVALRATAFLA